MNRRGVKPSATWPTITLGELAVEVTKGESIQWQGEAYQAAGIPFIRTVNVRPTGLDLSDVAFVSPQSHARMKRSQLKANDLLLSIAGTLGRCCVVPAEAVPANINQDVALVRIERDDVKLEYVLAALRSTAVARQIDRVGRGAGRIHLNLQQVRALSFPLPPIADQRRIAALLDKADAIRRKRQQTIRLADALLRSAFLDMFGDPVTNPRAYPVGRLGDIATIVSGVTKGRKLDPTRVVSVPYMRVANVQDGHLLLSDVKEIEALPEEIARYRLETGDVLLTEGGDPDKLGRGAVWRGDIDPCIHQNHIFRVRANASTLLPDFLSAQLGSTRGKRYFARAAKQTTGIASINMTQLSAFPVLVPPLGAQAAYGAFVERFLEFERRLHDRHAACDGLCASLAQEAFEGHA